MDIKYLVTKDEINSILEGNLHHKYKSIIKVDTIVLTAVRDMGGVRIIAFDTNTRKVSNPMLAEIFREYLVKEQFEDLLKTLPCIIQESF